MKSYTDILQSKKLAEILPLESADMYYFTIIRDYPYSQGKIKTIAKIMDGSFSSDYDTPCWSLSALIGVLPKKYYPVKDHETNLILGKPKDKWCVLYWDTTGMQHGEETLGDNPVDACYEMIIKLNELKLL